MNYKAVSLQVFSKGTFERIELIACPTGSPAEKLVPSNVAAVKIASNVFCLNSRSGYHRYKKAVLFINRPHGVLDTKLTVGDVDKIWSLQQHL